MSERPPLTPDSSQCHEERVEGLEKITWQPALQLLRKSHILPHIPANAVLLDNACGGGILTATLLNELEKDGESLANAQAGGLRVICGDLEPKMVEKVSDMIKVKGWEKIVTGQLVDAQKPPFPDEHFTHILMNFGPQVLPDPELMCRETLRILRPSGIVGFTAWSKLGWLPSIQAVFPSFILPSIIAEKWTDAKLVSQKMSEMGFKEVSVTEYEYKTKMNVRLFVEVVVNAIYVLKAKGNKEKYLAYLLEQADAEEEMETRWNTLIIVGKK